MSLLQGKVALVTGGNSGIGLAVARAFHANGAKVVLSGRNRETLEEVSRELGQNVLTVPTDVMKLGDLDDLMTRAHETFGKLDIMLVNAGIVGVGTIETTDEKTFDTMIDTNFKGAYFTIQKALPFFNDNGSIIVTGSINAWMSSPISPVYSASKAAVHSLTRSLALALIPRGIRVNTLTVGPTETPIIKDVPLEHKQGIANQLPIKRLGRPEEIANAALFLASDNASFMVGSELTVDGGALLNTL